MTYTIEDKLKCIRRELALRRNVYSRWIKAGKMAPHAAKHEIEVMEAIEADYSAKGDEHG